MSDTTTFGKQRDIGYKRAAMDIQQERRAYSYGIYGNLEKEVALI